MNKEIKKEIKNKKQLLDAIATLSGTTIGAGIFALPYVFASSSFTIGLLNLTLVFFIILFINLLMAKITLLSKKPMELTGYAKIFFGNKGRHLMALILFLSLSGSLLAYIIGAGKAIASLFKISSFAGGIFFFIIMSTIVYFDLKGVKESETIFTALMILIVIILSLIAIVHFNPHNLNFSIHLSLPKWFLPYGAILFSYLGIASIPEMRQELRDNEKDFKKAILIGTLIPYLIYLLFVIAILGVNASPNEVATIGLKESLGFTAGLLADLFVIFAMVTSFITLALALRWVLQYDYKINRFFAWLLSCFVPFLMFILGINSFIKVISITGAIAGGLQCIMILFMSKKMDRIKKIKNIKEIKIKLNFPLFILLLLFFILGIIYQFFF